MTHDRRDFFKIAGITVLGDLPFISRAAAQMTPATREPDVKADYTIRIGTGLVELAPDRIISTTTYNGQFPDPLTRLKEGQRVVVDIHNNTDTPEQLHWHGRMVPVDVDGASEEGTPFIPAHGMRRIAFLPKPTGFRLPAGGAGGGGDIRRHCAVWGKEDRAVAPVSAVSPWDARP